MIVYQADSVAREASPVVYERALPGQPVGILAQAEQVSGGGAWTAAVVSRPGPLSGTTADSPELRGQLLEATLVTPVTVSSVNERTPVLAEVTQGPLQGAVLVGQAVITRDGLVGIQFTTIITKDEQERRFTGIAYDAVVGRPGIEGRVSTMMPGAVTALTAATLQAAGDYFRARVQQQVTVTNGVLAVTPATPTFWDSLAATVAKAFAPAAPSTAGPTIVTRLERGTTFTVMVM